jgi:hypothetical protein
VLHVAKAIETLIDTCDEINKVLGNERCMCLSLECVMEKRTRGLSSHPATRRRSLCLWFDISAGVWMRPLLRPDDEWK